jgi:hypothetical protein
MTKTATDAYSFATPDPTFAFVGGQYCPTLDFVTAFFDYDCILHINFAILYVGKNKRPKSHIAQKNHIG